MILTFHGPQRMGEKESQHLHESPPIMLIPLGVLAVLSVFGGWINVPGSVRESFFGGFGTLPMSGWLKDWLAPVTASADAIRLEQLGAYAYQSPVGGGHVTWGFIATGLAMAVVILASRYFLSRPVPVASADSAPTGLSKVLYNKWYVDEIYDRIIVRPIVALSRFLWRTVDRVIIDGTVNAVGSVSRGFGWVGSLIQTGQLNTYAFILVLGALALLGALVL
jgi:NADH-quinone oxidoreductase subunit L